MMLIWIWILKGKRGDEMGLGSEPSMQIMHLELVK